ncbi:Alpha-D-kanosaminyltransferase [Tautonia plasticadhaerens]|uniref:Alpha-D-kanosaminyltransferase n=2 Tax=Tautonia plasticadhaerens TaxID=2527974 RepID=A0A518GXQ1_9BACT|nr:glycosyltransferase [Tautonia plasticadhaerens]QDV33343.1 Alpha-D-kanosaminyltransferase [Tautonia plasticadhaerens]
MPSLAYLVNSYPMPSLTFIRREIAALEDLGWTVARYAVRDSGLPRVDPDDQLEYERTRRLLDAGPIGLLGATLAEAVRHPGRFLRSLQAAWRIGKASGRGIGVHLAYLAEASLLKRWADRDGVAHVHVHFGTNPATVALLSRLLGGPSYSLTVHGPEEFDSPRALALGEKVRHASFVAAISSFGRSQLWRWSDPDDWDKVRVVRCGLDAKFLRQEATDPPDLPRLLNIGRLDPQKGQLVLVEAAAELARRGREFELAVIGDGAMRAALEELIERRGLRGKVTLLGWRSGPEVREALGSSRALVLSSFAEGLPVVIMEALALHRPVISTAIAGIPELVRPGESGWLVPAGAVGELADAMEEALDASTDRLRRMGAAGAARVAADHDVSTEAARLASYFPTAGPGATRASSTPVSA